MICNGRFLAGMNTVLKLLEEILAIISLNISDRVVHCWFCCCKRSKMRLTQSLNPIYSFIFAPKHKFDGNLIFCFVK